MVSRFMFFGQSPVNDPGRRRGTSSSGGSAGSSPRLTRTCRAQSRRRVWSRRLRRRPSEAPLRAEGGGRRAAERREARTAGAAGEAEEQAMKGVAAEELAVRSTSSRASSTRSRSTCATRSRRRRSARTSTRGGSTHRPTRSRSTRAGRRSDGILNDSVVCSDTPPRRRTSKSPRSPACGAADLLVR